MADALSPAISSWILRMMPMDSAQQASSSCMPKWLALALQKMDRDKEKLWTVESPLRSLRKCVTVRSWCLGSFLTILSFAASPFKNFSAANSAADWPRAKIYLPFFTMLRGLVSTCFNFHGQHIAQLSCVQGLLEGVRQQDVPQRQGQSQFG